MTLANDVKAKLAFQPGDREPLEKAEVSIKRSIARKYGWHGWRYESVKKTGIRLMRENYLKHGPDLLVIRTLGDLQIEGDPEQ